MSKTYSKSNIELKRRARLAKQRLKMGFFNTVLSSPNNSMPVVLHETAFTTTRNNAVAVYSRKAVSVKNSSKNLSEEILYKKICILLSSSTEYINPIGQLVDYNIYNMLDDTGKQRYILQLSAKFRELSTRYYAEQHLLEKGAE